MAAGRPQRCPDRSFLIGCGWGALEVELMQRGAAVTALALDSVIGASSRKTRDPGDCDGPWRKD